MLLFTTILYRYKNYYLLCELLERLRCSRNSFFHHHKVERYNAKINELKVHLSETDLDSILQKVTAAPSPPSSNLVPQSLSVESQSSPSPKPGCSKDSGDDGSSAEKENDREIELVTMGHYSLRKLMNFKLCRVGV